MSTKTLKLMKISKPGFEEIQKKIQALQNERVDVLERRNTAREFGDLKENSEFTEATTRLTNIDLEIKEYMEQLENCSVLENIEPTDYVAFGCKVTIENNNTKKKNTYYVLGEYESDIDRNVLSETSPIVFNMERKKVGEDFSLPNGNSFTIVNISYPKTFEEIYQDISQI